jgi:polyisoprenoid-binding protein YceI
MFKLINCLAAATLLLIAGLLHADSYALDPQHTAVIFKIEHLGISWTFGRFNDVTGEFNIDADPSKCQMTFAIKADSLDTGVAKRDEHLRSPDFFNVKQYPYITFKSASVQNAEGGYKITGTMYMHGVQRKVAFNLQGGKTAEFPKGTHRIGYTSQLKLNRADFGMDRLSGPVGDEVFIAISFEGIKKG